MEDYQPIEQVLRRFTPAAPPATLRGRVLAVAGAGTRRTAASWGDWVFRFAAAAALLIALALNTVTDGMTRRSAARVGVGPPVWNEDAETIAKVLNGNGWGRRYIALGLRASNGAAPERPSDKENPS